MGPEDHSADVRKHGSMTVRVLLVIAGTACVVLGIVGLITPVLPTTPFLLVAAACYARASSRFYNLLLNNRTFGPIIQEWRRYRSIRYRTKLTAIALMAITLATSIVFFVQEPWLRLGLSILGVALAIWMYRIPSRQ